MKIWISQSFITSFLHDKALGIDLEIMEAFSELKKGKDNVYNNILMCIFNF